MPGWLASLGVLVSGIAMPVHAERIAGVRTSDARLAEAIRTGADQSRTFADLVRAVAELNGIVYVEPGTCRRHARACLTAQVTTAGRHRILFVLVDPGLPESWVIELIAHELQHAVEVLSDRSVSMSGALLGHIGPGKAEEFVVHKRNEPVERGRIAVAPRQQQRRSIVASSTHGDVFHSRGDSTGSLPLVIRPWSERESCSLVPDDKR